VGQRLIDSAARSIIRQSLEALNEYLKVETALVHQTTQSAAESETTPAVSPKVKTSTGEYKPPSQATLAKNVAMDVLDDFIPARYQPWVLGGVAVVIVLIIWLISSR
jgi:hypothetical protein